MAMLFLFLLFFSGTIYVDPKELRSFEYTSLFQIIHQKWFLAQRNLQKAKETIPDDKT